MCSHPLPRNTLLSGLLSCSSQLPTHTRMPARARLLSPDTWPYDLLSAPLPMVFRNEGGTILTPCPYFDRCPKEKPQVVTLTQPLNMRRLIICSGCCYRTRAHYCGLIDGTAQACQCAQCHGREMIRGIRRAFDLMGKSPGIAPPLIRQALSDAVALHTQLYARAQAPARPRLTHCSGCGQAIHGDTRGRPRKWCDRACMMRTRRAQARARAGQPIPTGTSPAPPRFDTREAFDAWWQAQATEGLI